MIGALVMDVDGTLTDGKIYMGPGGEVCKAFDAKDGLGIHDLLPRSGIAPVIITGRVSEIVERRAAELGITHLYQGVRDKSAYLKEIAASLGIPLEQVACIGDDLNDLPMLRLCGVREICDYICQSSGGRGAVREFIEWIIQKNREE